MPAFHRLFYLAGLLLAALIAGLLYGYSCSVNPGLARLSDVEYLKAMQAINEAIQNPLFFLSFAGTLVALPAAAWLGRRNGWPGWPFLLAAALLYAAGVFSITAIGNVPLNNTLAALDLRHLDAPGLKSARAAFEGPWNRYHQVRTVCTAGAFVLALLPFVRR